MKYHRTHSILHGFLLAVLILSSCTGLPGLPTPTAGVPTPTAFQQSLPPALVETSPPLGTVIGHLSPLTFYFNQPLNRASAESAFSGLPAGSFTWTDDSTLVFTPSQAYAADTRLRISIGNTLQSANGLRIAEPAEASFTVADYLRPANLLPQSGAGDVNVDAAIAVSFNQPVVALGEDPSALLPAFKVEPDVPGRGEWINTSTYIFYPEPSLHGGTEYTVSLDQKLKTVTGVGLEEGSDASSWSFTTARPRVVTFEPSSEEPLPLDPQIKLTFNQPMDARSVESNFLFSGTEGSLNGEFSWNDVGTELTFTPSRLLNRDVGYILNVGAAAQSRGGMTLGTDFGAVWTTYDDLAVTATDPQNWSTIFTFSAPLAIADYEDAITITPVPDDLQIHQSDDGLMLFLNGYYPPETDFQIELSTDIEDRWGQALSEPFVLNFRTAALPPMLQVRSYGSSTAFVRPAEPAIFAEATGVQTAIVNVASLSLQDYFSLQNSYENQQAYTPAESTTLTQTLDLVLGDINQLKLDVTEQDQPLVPGLYYVNLATPQIPASSKNIYFVVSSDVNLTLKLGATEALVWAVGLDSRSPVANAPVAVYDEAGNQLASGTTDRDGLWKGTFDAREGQAFAVLGQPGEANFALAANSWSHGLNAWEFGYSQWVRPPQTTIYMYTDRPIYRPGHTVHFRGVARQAFNARYELPPLNTVPLKLLDSNGVELDTLELQLSPYGTFNGEFTLSEDAVPGYYLFQNDLLGVYFSFQVAEFRKPEINLSVESAVDEIKLGDTATATVDARYFFDAPVGDTEIRWTLYARPDHFHLPGYQTGLVETDWLSVFRYPHFGGQYLGDPIGDGTGRTTPEGTLSIDLPAIPARGGTPQIVTLEVVAQDESGLPVSARSEMRGHPEDFYIGVLPDEWVGRANRALGFEVYTADWNMEPSGERRLSAEFKQVRWERQTDQFGLMTYQPVYTPVSSSDFVTGADGKARLSFTPPGTGTFMLDVFGGEARTQSLVWVGGAGTASWPELPNQRIEITADRDSYRAGDTANIFIPNPFAANSPALISVERGVVSKADVITLNGSGAEYSLPITEDDAPNVYVSVTVLGPDNDFRHGLVNLPVAPEALALNVEVNSSPARAGPREDVTFELHVTDHEGQPVEGEFSLSVVDLATLALADPNSEDILPAFYKNQPLGIETALSLAVYSGREAIGQDGFGGGGGEGPPFIREDFPDTAYWNPSLITNSEGRGQVTMTLPDSLTTWQVDVRGLTVDTRVGQAETQIVTTKPLLIRPVTPRFMVHGDHVLMAAVLNNNTADTLSVSVNLQSEGFVLDEPGLATQQVQVPANSRARVEWWGTAAAAEAADLVFSAATTGTPSLQDSARPVWGALPILQYTAPQTFVTGGVLRGASARQEVISLPRTFTPEGGGLDVELSPSLAGTLISTLEAMDVPDYAMSAEANVSFLLPNLEVYRALNNAGLSDPDLSARVTSSITTGVSRLLSLQNNDGGWSWWGRSPDDGWAGGPSDPYISAYVFFGLLRARAIGMAVDESRLQRAGAYLTERIPAITPNTAGARLDEIAFIQFTLAHANTFNQATIDHLYEARERMSPSGRALLAFIIHSMGSADSRVRDLISNLESSAILTASGAHWETARENILVRGSPIYTTSMAVYVLAQLDPANQVVFNAVRYLAAHRGAGGAWGSGHDNAWAMMALNEAMLGFGDLSPDFTFDATLNGGPLSSGAISGNQVLTPMRAHVPIEFLSPESPNLLTIQRDDGLGRLYYRAALEVNRPVEDVQPLDSGMRIERTYLDSECRVDRDVDAQECPPLSTIQLGPDKRITAQLTLILPHDTYYVMVEDAIPAGAEILNRALKTSEQGVDGAGVEVQFDESDPFASGWGWWLFHEPQIRDDGILFTADYLPAGTYVLTYTLVPLQAGEYRVMPAHAWESFFPEVQGTSAGTIFEIKP